MAGPDQSHDVSRRDVLKLGAVGAATAAGARLAEAQTPRRGGIFRIGGADPPHFDPHQSVNWWTFIYLSLTHSRLVKHVAGPGVTPGSLPIEGDLAESWDRPSDTTYVFKLRKGVRWHPKAPLSGRELTSEDVVYTFMRAVTLVGNPRKAHFEDIEKVEALDRHTVKVTLRQPNAWFLETAGLEFILAKEVADKHGDFKKSEAVVGSGPWMLERYDPNVRATFVRNPHYFRPDLPYVDGIELRIDADPSSKLAAWLGGQYDFAPDSQMTVRRSDLETVLRRKPNLSTQEFIWLTSTLAAPKLEEAPFGDVRVRRALYRAVSGQQILDVNPWGLGQGAPNPTIPAALRDWTIPIDQLPKEGRLLYEQDVAEAKRLLSQAGYARGLRFPVDSTGSWGPDFSDIVLAILGQWKNAGITTDLKLKEGTAFLASLLARRFEKMAITLRGGASTPERYLVDQHLAGQPLNWAGVNDPRLTDMIQLQRRTFDRNKRREIIYDIQRHCSEQAYYLFVSPSAKVVAAWEPYVKNFMPNISLDYGGRLMIAWLDR